MSTSISDYSYANSFRLSEGNKNGGPLCHCGRKTSLTKSWSDDNPGRLYFRCEVHTFVAWSDEEKACMWQKASLLEARDIMRRQRDEIRQLKAANAKLLRDWNSVQESQVRFDDDVPAVDPDKNLEVELIKAAAREKMIRHCLSISWVGFIVATAIIASRCFK
ncbi:uncharacterized protein LOC108815419 [Raphanus sativus]|uniref:Uncharacterized protein LOC108815419 n=1 Tax=Raphanus sativus TaxID=3726 RepID=A0A6J0K7T8_RAPSA|nr:uncharacterized protein LOC108815419 [Raphanus sativus]